jgi:hypothetical protein
VHHTGHRSVTCGDLRTATTSKRARERTRWQVPRSIWRGTLGILFFLTTGERSETANTSCCEPSLTLHLDRRRRPCGRPPSPPPARNPTAYKTHPPHSASARTQPNPTVRSAPPFQPPSRLLVPNNHSTTRDE